MSFAIQRQDNTLIWFDCVESFTKSFPATVSKYPIAAGSVGSGASFTISDHVAAGNPALSLKVVLSDVDFNTTRPIGFNILNNSPVNQGVAGENVIIENTVGLSQYLPESISQFFGSDDPEVSLASMSTKAKSAISIQSDLEQMSINGERFTLIGFMDGVIRDIYYDCVFTSVDYDEGVDTGDSISVSLQIEQIRIAYVSETTAPVQKRKTGRKKSGVPDKSAKPKDCGSRDSTSTQTGDGSISDIIAGKAETTGTAKTSAAAHTAGSATQQ
jgi:hypothetical protein